MRKVRFQVGYQSNHLYLLQDLKGLNRALEKIVLSWNRPMVFLTVLSGNRPMVLFSSAVGTANDPRVVRSRVGPSRKLCSTQNLSSCQSALLRRINACMFVF